MSDWGYRDDDDDLDDVGPETDDEQRPARILLMPAFIGWWLIPRVWRQDEWLRLPAMFRTTLDDALATAYEFGWAIQDDLTPDVVVRERR